MANSRRIARELALKVLFQVDVGKQPIAEALGGTLEQLRTTVDNPIAQIARAAEAELRRAAAQESPVLSTQSARQIKQTALSAVSAVQALADRAAAATCALVSAAPASDLPAAAVELRAALEEARTHLARLAARDTLHPDLQAQLIASAAQKAEQIEAAFKKNAPAVSQIAAFAARLVQGAVQQQKEIDARLESLSSGWRLERQAAVDRNILRLAAYEMLYLSDIPTGATINEAVELAKKYSTAESGRFVNGVLGALAGQAEG